MTTRRIISLVLGILILFGVAVGIGWAYTNWGSLGPRLSAMLKTDIAPPSSSPPAAEPPPAVTSAPPANVLLLWFNTLGYYQEQGIKGISVDTRRPPFVAELSADHLPKDYLDVLMKDAQEEMSRPGGTRKFKITAVTRVQFYLTEDKERLDSAFVYVDGTDPDGKPLIDATHETGVMVYLSEVTWTAKKSSDFAREILDAMQSEHGIPDRGEVFRHRGNKPASKAVKLTKK